MGGKRGRRRSELRAVRGERKAGRGRRTGEAGSGVGWDVRGEGAGGAGAIMGVLAMTSKPAMQSVQAVLALRARLEGMTV